MSKLGQTSLKLQPHPKLQHPEEEASSIASYIMWQKPDNLVINLNFEIKQIPWRFSPQNFGQISYLFLHVSN